MDIQDPIILTDDNLTSLKGKFLHCPIKISCIHNLEDSFKTKGLGIKYVYSGLETYVIDKKQYNITGGNYLLTNSYSGSCDMQLTSKNGQPNWGVCVDLENDYLIDIIQSIQHPNEIEYYAKAQQFFLSDELFQTLTLAGPKLNALFHRLIALANSGKKMLSPNVFIHELSAAIICNQKPLLETYYKLNVTKSSTRKELYKRLSWGKQIIDDRIYENLTVPDIANMVCLSEFRFYHLFKQVFHTTPYHYILRQKIEKSIQLKAHGIYAWNDIALLLGFSDIQSFSKTFKKLKGVPPTKFNIAS